MKKLKIDMNTFTAKKESEDKNEKVLNNSHNQKIIQLT